MINSIMPEGMSEYKLLTTCTVLHCTVLYLYKQPVLDTLGTNPTSEAEVESALTKYTDPLLISLAKASVVLKTSANANPAPAATFSSTSSTGPSSTGAKLPKVNLLKFSGKNPAEYSNFWNQFISLIDSDTSLDNVQKLIYLQSCFEGEAKVIADGYQLTADNCDNLCEQFESLFGSKCLIVQFHAD